jgi:uncharacterized membrane protein YccC
MAAAAKPPLAAVVVTLIGAVVSMAMGVYFAGQEQLPLAMTGAGLFVLLGGIGFELARRRSG